MILDLSPLKWRADSDLKVRPESQRSDLGARHIHRVLSWLYRFHRFHRHYTHRIFN